MHFQVHAQNINWKSNFVKVNNIKLHYLTAGNSNEVIVFLHGALQTYNAFKFQYPAFEKNYTLIAIETRGHGVSSFKDTLLTYQLFADDVAKLLAELNIKSATVIGWSDGGITALALAIKYPSLVKKMVTIGANAAANNSAISSENIAQIKAWENPKNMKNLVDKTTKNFTNNPNPELIPLFIKRMQTMLLTEPNFITNDLALIQCPTLLIYGENDIVKAAHYRWIKNSIHGAELKVITGAGHYVPQQKAQEVNGIIFDFLKMK